MMLNNENHKDKNKLFRSKALYITLSVCVLAAGVIGVTGMKNTKNIKKSPTEITTEQPTYVNIQKRPDFDTSTESIILPEIPTIPVVETTIDAEPVFEDDEVTEEATTEETTKEKAPDFRTPLSVSIGTDYSMGIPVFSSTMSDYRTHNGVDFLGAKGDDVASIGEGDVIDVKKDAVWGNCVTVDHGKGVISTVCGLADDDKLVAAGTHVYTGTVIGRVGEVPVEASDDSHVHLEVRYNDILMDPLTLLGLDGSRETE